MDGAGRDERDDRPDLDHVAVSGFKFGKGVGRTGTLVFEGSEFAGAEVQVRLSVPMRVFIEARQAGESHDWEGFLAYFVDKVIVGWNLQHDDGTPIPLSAEGMQAVPFDFLMRLVTEWAGQVGQVPAPLVSASSNGKQSVEASLPMASP